MLFNSYIRYMINIDWVYSADTYEGIREENDIDGNTFNCYICYGNRLLGKVYDLQGDDIRGRVIFINKNWKYKKYTLYWYYQMNAVIWFILWILYNGERESN
jgi:hypothetical protein